MKTTIGTVALIAFAGMKANALGIRQADADSSIAEYLRPEAGGLAQTSVGQSNDYRSVTWNVPLKVVFENTSNEAVTLYWIDY